MKKIILLLVFVELVQLVSASHYIVGIVNDALDGENANGKEVVLWNPAKGIDDNLTDVIGPSGNSGTDNVYMIDCELLSSGCKVGDEMRAQVLKENNYLSYWVNLSVTGAGYDIAPNMTLNSIPNATLLSPINYENESDETTFVCSASDFDGLSNVTLYGNWSEWHANETIEVTGTYNETTFIKNLSEGKYVWGCLVTDNLSISNFSENYTLTIDRTSPAINEVSVNESYVCGDVYVRVNCSAQDAFTDINSVTIEAISPSMTKNYSTSFNGVYYSDIFVNETGIWKFNCIANDSAGNLANLTSSELIDYYEGIDLTIDWINFSNYNPLESQPVIIEAEVHNNGCSASGSFLAGFYKNGLDEQINGNQTLSIAARSNQTVNVTWTSEIGTTTFYVVADIEDSVIESDESNNEANKSLSVGAWQNFYGNISLDKLLGNNQSLNITLWENLTNLQGNVFVADIESDVEWLNLQAIGRDKFGNPAGNDFSDIDSLLGMTSFNDSIYNLFTDSGTPKQTDSFLVHQKVIDEVAVVNSTDNTNFLTGILWDMSDDFDGEYSQEDGEDLVFAAKINQNSPGAYGTYDYEIKIPVRLREYKSPDTSDVYLYYDLK